MKAFKKITAVFLACLMLAGSLAVNAGAMDIIKFTPVSEISINLNSNIGGLSPKDYEKFLKIETEGVSFDPGAINELGAPFFVSTGGPKNIIAGIAPASAVSKADAMNMGKFVEGETYRMSLFMVLDDGYILANDHPVVTVNGIGVRPYVSGPKMLEVDFSFTVGDSSGFMSNLLAKIASLLGTDKVKNIELEASSAIAGLQMMSYERFITIKSRGIEFDDYDWYAVDVYDITDDFRLDPDDAFVDGHEYGFTVYLTTDSGKYFVDEDKLTASVNGKSADDVDVPEDNDNIYANVSFTLTVDGEPAPGKQISEISLSVKDDIAGKSAKDYKKFIKIETDNMGFDEDGYSVIYIYNAANGNSLSPDEKLVAGREYRIQVYFLADSGYEFATENMNATVNGKAASHYGYNDSNLRQSCIYFDITVTEPTSSGFLAMIREFFANIIDSITGIFVREPV